MDRENGQCGPRNSRGRKEEILRKMAGDSRWKIRRSNQIFRISL